MEVKILVCTHGHFGEELIKSVEMIGGHLKNTVAVSLLENMSMDDYYEAVKNELDKNAINFCLTDLFGGTPCNTLLNLSQDYKMEILCGVNLPVLLETSNCDFSSIEEVKKHLLDTYKISGFDILERMRELNYVD